MTELHKPESLIQQQIRLFAARLGLDFWRNNSGALPDEKGRIVRYGLANDSAQLNAQIKSSDLIGITPVWAYVEGIGWTWLGVFTAVECKPEGWVFSQSDKRAVAQKAFHDIVRKNGGFAGFAVSIDDFKRITGK